MRGVGIARWQKCRHCGEMAPPKGQTQTDSAFQCGPCYVKFKREERKRRGLK